MLSVDGDADAAVESRVHVGWSGFGQLVLLLGSRDVSLMVRGGLCSGCVISSMLHGSGTWPVGKGSGVALWRVEMAVIRWMCGIGIKDGVQVDS